MKSKVAILMATYNGMPYIKEQIDTILSQEGVEVHIFISDDSSSDGTLEYIRGLENQKITILDNSNEKIGSAGRNFFYLICNVDVSGYDYAALADQDDIWLKNKIEKAIICIKNHNAVGYSSGFCAIWQNGKKKYFNKSPKLVKYDYLFSSPGPGCTYVLKTSIIQSMAKYISINKNISQPQYHDWAIYAWVRSMDFSWIIDTNSYILYRQHSSNDTGVNNGLKAIGKRLNWIIKGWYTAQIIQVLNFTQYTCNFKKSVNCFNVGWTKFLIGFLSYRRSTRDNIFFIILIVFNIVNLKNIKDSIAIIEQKKLI